MDPQMEVAYQYVLLNIQEMIILLLQIQKKTPKQPKKLQNSL